MCAYKYIFLNRVLLIFLIAFFCLFVLKEVLKVINRQDKKV